MRSHINKDVQRWMKWFLPFYLFTFLPLVAQAQSITGRAPQQVAAGELFGDVAQLGERLPCKQEVESSTLFVST